MSRTIRLVVCAAAMACGDGQQPATGPDPDAEPRASLPALILSNPAVPGTAMIAGSRAALVDPVAYASLPPGSIPDGALALFTNVSSGAGATAPIVSGGFDPVPIPASVGDSLRISVQSRDDREEQLFYAKVAPRRPPTVVRSEPAAGRRDVPLNTRILVVFSEPVSAATLVNAAVQLLKDAVPVAGTLAFADSAHISMAITPYAPLAAGTTYAVRISEALTDGDGEALGARVSIPFTTQSPSAGSTPGGGILGCCGALDASFERTVPHSVGYGQSEFILRADGTFTMRYTIPAWDWQQPELSYHGAYTRADSIVELVFGANAGHPMGPWAAVATLRGDLLAVRFNDHAGLDDFEDGDYRRRPAGGTSRDGSGRGTLRLAVSTSGADAPLAAYGLLSGDAIRSVIDGSTTSDHPTFAIGTNELSLAPGRYTLALQPPAQCAASAPVTFDIAPDSTTGAGLSITCTAWASLSVSHAVASVIQPPESRIIYVCDGGSCADYWPSAGEVMQIRVAAGQYRVLFYGFNSNCREVPTDGVLVTVSPGERRSVDLTVYCRP